MVCWGVLTPVMRSGWIITPHTLRHQYRVTKTWRISTPGSQDHLAQGKFLLQVFRIAKSQPVSSAILLQDNTRTLMAALTKKIWTKLIGKLLNICPAALIQCWVTTKCLDDSKKNRKLTTLIRTKVWKQTCAVGYRCDFLFF